MSGQRLDKNILSKVRVKVQFYRSLINSPHQLPVIVARVLDVSDVIDVLITR